MPRGCYWMTRFLSTPSARRATAKLQSPPPGFFYFYPRPLRGGRPAHQGADRGLPQISIHALCEESDRAMLASKPRPEHFYPRPLRGGRQVEGEDDGAETTHFYPRPPRGGRQQLVGLDKARRVISIHALREEGDTQRQEQRLTALEFLSTPSARRATATTDSE